MWLFLAPEVSEEIRVPVLPGQIVILIAIFMLSVGCSSKQAGQIIVNDPKDIADVEATIESWFNDAIATVDTSKIGAFLTPTFGSTEPIGWLDKHAFLEWITTFEEEWGGAFSLEYSLYDWHTTVRGNVAWSNMWNDGVLTVEGQAPQYMRWAESGVLLRQADGRWLIDRYHSTFLGSQSEPFTE